MISRDDELRKLIEGEYNEDKTRSKRSLCKRCYRREKTTSGQALMKNGALNTLKCYKTIYLVEKKC